MAPCANCGHDNAAGAKFCARCGQPLTLACPSCGSAYRPDDLFCVECGAALTEGGAPPAVVPAAAPAVAPVAERRLVSVLFADLVGFTTLSERRDAEEVRELLSRYFDTCSRLIRLYGGTVEKFIGDAVMAVWGTPTATEDDAERAVRAALDLVAAVSALGDEVGAPELRARAGVLTGEAAVTIGAEGQGMVAGDLVNTAARIQSAAEPGTVLVGETTRRTTEQTVVYENAGSHALKGKEEPVPLWHALRIVSGARGSLKSHGLEAPFVGRDRELRRIKDLFHECAAGGKAHLVSVTGIAGIGKSRLAWEFYKYFDGIAQITYWHRGRCLSYGDGVTYWALADMVRMRCRIGEEEEPPAALEKLHVALEEHLIDPEERAFVEPRLAHLLGLAEHSARDKQDLFAAWRLFFERLADVYPTVLAFEDMQWADASLLDFVEYLLEWSRNSPLYVITLARPEFAERRPTWGAGLRNFTSLYLEPLSGSAMDELLAGLVPGLPDRTREQILARAEGVPLYAVETVRMLLDRGLIAQEGSVYRPVAEIGELDVPETLHALIAARLDGLSPDERRLLQDGAVLGKTFTRDGLGALSGLAEEELEPLLVSLVRKEVLGLQADARSPEHGQYGFLQDLVRHVAYETLSRHERRSRHLAAADHLRAAFDEDEIAEVVAAHYVDAYEVNPEAADAAEVRAKAREALVRAGDRAESLAASGEAQRYFGQAAGLTDDPREKAELLDRAGWLAYHAADFDGADRLLGTSVAMYDAEGDTHAAARVAGRLAQVERWQGHFDEAVERMERAYEVLADDEPDQDIALLLARLGGAYVFAGDLDRAKERIERSIEIAESLGSAVVLASAFNMRAIAVQGGRPQEALAFLEQARAIALEHDLEALGSIYFNLSDAEFHRDRYVDALGYLQEALEFSRRRGSRLGEWATLAETTYPLYMLGRWDEALAAAALIPEDRLQEAVTLSLLASVTEIQIHRGNPAEARRVLSLYPETSSDVQEMSSIVAARAAVLHGESRLEEALAAGLKSLDPIQGAEYSNFSNQQVKQGFLHALEVALALGRREQADELLTRVEKLPRGFRPPYLEAQARRLRARLEVDETGYAAAATGFGELGMPFWVAVSRLEHAELLDAGEESERLLADARETFQRLEAKPWLDRVDAAQAGARTRIPA
jgi:class 3 adenylate cyclase/tetratricopeptide (TPR) repeat protein